ncbi:NmrA family NAD(P)-binding protein [Streptomyces sp. S3(2020)]|uniref:NmrA family NAD(P)-binding protein n=1 Tax=Streptomyces sp. S3(2020) TaxID=2732044 RepID=UPI0014896902|nr:NmrA family NAD(P)-binding protein [Streptomyces sp. S3(2020)]
MILVTGATGNVGRALVDRLLAAGRPVRALTRDPRRAVLPDGVEVMPLHPDEPVFEGATKLFLYVQAANADLLAAARRAGVRHVVFLSAGYVKEDADDSNPLRITHDNAERAIRDSGLAWTFLRPHAFALNALQWAGQIRAGDTVRGVHPGAMSAPIHEDDIAAVAEHALLDVGHEGAAHILTGPAATSNADQITGIGRALGRDLEYVEVPPERAAAELFPHLPPHLLQFLLKSWEAAVGATPEITDTVEKITGTPARTFEQWARDHAEAFRN